MFISKSGQCPAFEIFFDVWVIDTRFSYHRVNNFGDVLYEFFKSKPQLIGFGKVKDYGNGDVPRNQRIMVMMLITFIIKAINPSNLDMIKCMVNNLTCIPYVVSINRNVDQLG